MRRDVSNSASNRSPNSQNNEINENIDDSNLYDQTTNNHIIDDYSILTGEMQESRTDNIIDDEDSSYYMYQVPGDND